MKNIHRNKIGVWVFLISIILVLWSCSSVFLLKISGYLKDPNLESGETVKGYCKKEGDPYDILWMPGNLQSFDTILAKYPGSPNVTIFDKNMNVVENAQGEECHKRLMGFLRDTGSTRYTKRSDASWSLLQRYCVKVDSNGEPDQYKYTVVYSWVKYTPRLTRDLFARLRNVRDSLKFKIRFISLNKDYQSGLHKEAPKLKIDKGR